jgi:biopolymer transport protein ExbB
MSDLFHRAFEVVRDSGVVVWAILGLSLLLYTRGFGLLLYLYRAQRQMERDYAANPHALPHLRILQDDLNETFQRQRVVLGAMVAAAPLLGLLGTVLGMIETFQNIASGGGGKVSDGLSAGISEALMATAAGLAVAIPGVLLLYVAHRQLQQGFQTFAHLEHQAMEAR